MVLKLHNDYSYVYCCNVQIFEPLNDQALKGVLGLKLSSLTKGLAARGVDFKVADSAMTYILERAASYKYGGRRMGK